MKISETGLAVVKAFEGCHQAVPGRPGYFKAYVDPVGVLTIGWGHTNHHEPKFTKNTVWSQEKCDQVKMKDMEFFERHVWKNAKVPLEQHEFDALVSWSFNTGGPASAGVWRELNAGRKKNVPAELAKWNKGGGKVLSGLVRRRKAEGQLFAGKIAEALATAGAKAPRSEPPHGQTSDEIRDVQTFLDKLGYHEVGTIDGKWGGRTAAAIAAFKNDRGLAGAPVIDAALITDLVNAKGEGWKRPIAPERKTATTEEVAKEVPELKPVQQTKSTSKWTAIVTAVTGFFAAIADYFQDALSWVVGLKAHAAEVPGWVWFFAAAVLAGIMYWLAKNGSKGIVDAFRKGERA